jgi:ribosomal protein S18 acetylase RimI-like enzyme
MPPFAEITTRPAETRDTPALARAWIDAGRFYERIDAEAFQTPEANGLQTWLAAALEAGEGLTLVAEVEGEVAGFVAARLLEPEPDAHLQLQRELTEKRLMIEALAVIEQQRHRGVGTALVRAAEAWGRDNGAVAILVDAHWSSGVAEGFYERALGYERRSLRLRK